MRDLSIMSAAADIASMLSLKNKDVPVIATFLTWDSRSGIYQLDTNTCSTHSISFNSCGDCIARKFTLFSDNWDTKIPYRLGKSPRRLSVLGGPKLGP